MTNDTEFIERRIITGLIISTDYQERVHPIWNPALLESPELKMIAGWCTSYFEKYSKVPDNDIQNIYMEHLKGGKLPKADAEYIEELLSDLSDEYGRDTQFNSAYLYDQTVQYLKTQELEKHNLEVQDLIDTGDIAEAEKLMQAYTPTIIEGVDAGLELSSKEAIKRVEIAFSETGQQVVSYPGALGKMLNAHFIRGGFVTFLAPEKRGKCLSGDQKVLMSTGEELTIYEIIEKNRKDIISFDDNTQSFIPSQISQFWKNGVKSIYQVTTKTGRCIEATINHPFLTPDGWRNLSEIKTGSFIAAPKHIPVFGKLQMKEFKIRLIAYFITEGCLREYNYKYARTKVLLFSSADVDIQKDFTRCIKKMECAVRWKGIAGSVINAKGNRNKHNKNYVLRMLRRLGLWNKLSYDKRIPNDVFQLPKKDLSLFLKVLYSCDGWVNEKEDLQIGFAVANEYLARQVHHLLSRFGIVAKISFKKNDKAGAWTVSIGDWENASRFATEIGFLYKKQNKLKKVLSIRKPAYKSFLDKFPPQIAKKFHDEVLFELEGCCDVIPRGPGSGQHQNIPVFRQAFQKASSVREQITKQAPIMRQSFLEVQDTKAGKKYFDSHILWDEVLDISYVGEKETFDLTIPETHNFIAENIIVHNSFLLMEIALRAIRQKANVAFFEAGDMTESQVLRRICVYLARKSDKGQYCQERFRPRGDCVLNQLDICTRTDRNCDHGIFEEVTLELFNKEIHEFANIETLKKKYEEFPEYETCRAYGCQKRMGAVWLQKMKRVQPLRVKQAKRNIRTFFKKYKRRFKLITYPAGTLTVTEMRNRLNDWERRDGFVPDIIVVDYADLLSADDGKVSEFRHRQDHIWKNLRAMSQERHLLLLSATQADADSYKKGRLSLSNFSEDKRKLAHVTAQYGLNQDPHGREKKLGVLRINEIVVREGAFSGDNEVVVLQDLAAGRPFLESYSSAGTGAYMENSTTQEDEI